MIHFNYPSSKGGGTFCGLPVEPNGDDDTLCEECLKIDQEMLPVSAAPISAKPKAKRKAKS